MFLNMMHTSIHCQLDFSNLLDVVYDCSVILYITLLSYSSEQ